MGLISVENALESILAGVVALPEEEVAIDEAIGRALAKTVVASRTLPPWDNSAMDGYAVRSEDASRPGIILRIVDRIFAGDVPRRTIGPGECARIMTGAPLPPGADAVVMQERTAPSGRAQANLAKIERATGQSLAEVKSRLVTFLSEKYGVPAVDLATFKLDPAARAGIPVDVIVMHRALPLAITADTLVVALADPTNLHAVDALAHLSGKKVEPMVAGEPDICQAIEKAYGLPAVEWVELLESAPAGASVRRAGEDTKAGEPLLVAGTPIGIPEAGLLWSQGLTHVTVRRRPRVAIASTGDELVPIGQPAGDKIYDTNSPSIAAAVRRAGGIPTLLGLAPDRLDDVKALFTKGLDFDVLITSAGASVGEKDFAKDALEGIGVTMDFWRVAMKPGKPLAVGKKGSTRVFGLPGNPTSSLVSFELFVRPALRALQGLPARTAELGGRLAEPVKKAPGLRHFVRARVETREGQLWATPLKQQSSGALTSAALATHLISIPPDASSLAAGDAITLIPVSWLGAPT